jgi:hypothetical protein
MIRQPEIVSVRLTELELLFLDAICKDNGINRHEYVRSIVIDALVEDGYDALRCRESQGRKGSGETSETCGATTP